MMVQVQANGDTYMLLVWNVHLFEWQKSNWLDKKHLSGVNRYVSPICHVLNNEASTNNSPVTRCEDGNEVLLTTRLWLKIIAMGFRQCMPKLDPQKACGVKSVDSIRVWSGFSIVGWRYPKMGWLILAAPICYHIFRLWILYIYVYWHEIWSLYYDTYTPPLNRWCMMVLHYVSQSPFGPWPAEDLETLLHRACLGSWLSTQGVTKPKCGGTRA